MTGSVNRVFYSQNALQLDSYPRLFHAFSVCGLNEGLARVYETCWKPPASVLGFTYCKPATFRVAADYN
jgi:hypothetical protein